MGVTFVNEAHLLQETALTSHVCNVPASVIDGDLLIAIADMDSPTDAWTRPAAFTDVQVANVVSTGNTTDISVRVASSEPASYTWTTGAGTLAVIVILAYRGNKASSYFNTTSHTTVVGTNPTTFPSVTTTVNGCALVSYVSTDNTNADGAGDYSTPTGYTERVDVQTVNGRQTVAVFDKLLIPPGTESGVQTNYTVSEPTVGEAIGVMAIEPLSPPALATTIALKYAKLPKALLVGRPYVRL
jgi:hypothetical protein